MIAFGGRSMGSVRCRNLNSLEKPDLLQSGRCRLNFTKASIQKLGYAVIVEGYFRLR